ADRALAEDRDMNLRPFRVRALAPLAVSCGIVLLERVFVQMAADRDIVSVLLAAGSKAPPLGAAMLALLVVATRVLALLVVPALLLRSAVLGLAYVVQREGEEGDGSTSIGISEGAEPGERIGGRGTK